MSIYLGANAYANLLLSLGVKDSTSGFRIYDAEFLKNGYFDD